MKNNQRVLAAALISAAITAVVAQPASATTVDLTGTYTATAGTDTGGIPNPSISSNGLPSPFHVDNMVYGGSTVDGSNSSNVLDSSGLLFTVVPNTCSSNCNGKDGTATITVTFSLTDAMNNATGTVTDTALATFDYTAPNSYTSSDSGTDNLCWSNTAISGNAVVAGQSAALGGSCGSAGGTVVTSAYEQIMVDLGGQYFDINLFDWNDWDEQPDVTFAWVDPPPPSRVPEPASLALFGAGVLGLGFVMARRRRRAAIKAA